MAASSKTEFIPILNIPNNERIDRLSNISTAEFGHVPLFFVRVPGRVNLIGEHIDYCGYPVLPMALEQDILIAVGILENSEVRIRNVDAKYDILNYKFTSCLDIDIKGKPYWYNYVLCGIKGALEYMSDKFNYGVELYVDGNIPPASGLSSSSALVSAACLAFLHANGEAISKSDIASLCAKSERYIGTQGGGMDQAIAFLAEKSCAQYITWNPLKATAVTLPSDATFVVAHSLAEANKAATNDFNVRVIECRLAAKILAVATNLETDAKILTLSEVQTLLDYSLNEMVKLVHKHINKKIYTKIEICTILKISELDLNDLYLTNNTKHVTEFKIKQRALHVYQEALRVEQFRSICINSISNGDHSKSETNGFKSETNGNSDILCSLGKLMSESHESLKTLYECSHENLDELVKISKEIHVHSRLTGAGWGGCIVALCHKNEAEYYIEKLKEEFYIKYCKADKQEISKYIFATTPNCGAVIYKK